MREPWNPVYKISWLSKFIWLEIPFWYKSDLLRQVLIPILVTIVNDFRISSNFRRDVIRTCRTSITLRILWIDLVQIIPYLCFVVDSIKVTFKPFINFFVLYSLCYWYILRQQQNKIKPFLRNPRCKLLNSRYEIMKKRIKDKLRKSKLTRRK